MTSIWSQARKTKYDIFHLIQCNLVVHFNSRMHISHIRFSCILALKSRVCVCVCVRVCVCASTGHSGVGYSSRRQPRPVRPSQPSGPPLPTPAPRRRYPLDMATLYPITRPPYHPIIIYPPLHSHSTDRLINDSISHSVVNFIRLVLSLAAINIFPLTPSP
jgi:hypothetical protein